MARTPNLFPQISRFSGWYLQPSEYCSRVGGRRRFGYWFTLIIARIKLLIETVTPPFGGPLSLRLEPDDRAQGLWSCQARNTR